MIISILAGDPALIALRPLREAYVAAGIRVREVRTGGGVPPSAALPDLVGAADALLLVGDRRRSPRTALPGPVLRLAAGRAVPAGWLPDAGPEALGRFARAAAHVHRREQAQVGVAVLSQWNPRYLRLAARIETLISQGEGALPAFRWSSDLLLREAMIDGVGSGLGLAIYVGHGRPIGWVGYRGTRAHHFPAESGEPLGALFSLCCLTASRRRTGLSFAEALPLQGRAAATLGAVRSTLHTDNTRWAVRLCTGLRQGARTVGDLVTRALPPTASAVDGYRLIGDPLAPLATPAAALDRARAIEVFP